MSAVGASRRGWGALAGLAAGCLLLVNAGALRREADLRRLPTARRFWEDVTIAMADYLAREREPAPPLRIASLRGQETIDRYQRYLTERTEELGLRPWEFWRTVPVKRALEGERLVGREDDDAGRALVSGLAFRARGGVAPYLPLWLGALTGAALLGWVGAELAGGGWPRAAVVFPVLVACSPFVAEILTLPYSPAGFQVAGLLGLAAFAAGALLDPQPTPVRVGLRALAAGLAFALCAICRSGVSLLLPGFLLAALLSARRLGRRRVLAAVGALGLLVAPYLAVRPARHHYVWSGIWEGLGDFDRSKGYAWFDPDARRALRAAGVAEEQLRPNVYGGYENGETDRVFRRLILADVAGDPAWYASILGQRLWGTLTQRKLWPQAVGGGRGFVESTSPNEGVIDVYYGLTTPADWIGIGGCKWEVPAALLLAPTLLLVAVWALGGRHPRLRPLSARAGAPLALVALVGAAALIQPVLITTASALETEAFVLTDLLALALLLDLARLHPPPFPPEVA